MIIFPACLDLFDGAQPSGDSTSAPAAGESGEPSAPDTHRRKQWKDLIEGQFKDLYTEDTQRIINRRFRDAKLAEESLRARQPVFDLLSQRCGIPADDLPAITALLDKTFPAPEDKKVVRMKQELSRLKRDMTRAEGQRNADRQVRIWYAQGEALKARYPDFDLAAQSRDPAFVSLLRAGIPVETAFEVRNLPRLRRQMEQEITGSIRAGALRVAENGTTAPSAAPVGECVSGFSRKDRADYIKRAARGEHIRF